MSRSSKFARRAALYLAAWLPMVILFGELLFTTRVASSRLVATTFALIYLTPAIVLGVPAIALSRRLVDQKVARLRWIGTHLSAAVAYTVLWHASYYGYFLIVAGEKNVRTAASGTWHWQLSYGMFVYGVIAGLVSTARSNQRMREHEVAAARAESLRVRAEMQALRGQLDPHFLFNTLHSITALVRIDARQAEEALVQFGALLRRLLDVKRDGIDETSLAEEMKFVDGYLALEQLRLGERLHVEQRLADEALGCYVPVLSVQPLVENAIRHAIAPRRDGGTIVITASVANGRLDIVVRDDGPGADPQSVAAATGTGLNVTRQRVHLRHGTAASLTVNTSPGNGFAVTMAIPAVNEPVFAAVS